MFYALNWIVVASLLGLWSLGLWAVHAVAMWATSNAGVLTAAASGAGGLRLPQWLAPWVPAEIVQAVTAAASALSPVIESALQAAPALAGGVTVAAWLVWGIGSVLLVVVGVSLHLLIAVLRRRRGGPGGRESLRAG
jgi:hypothetical protein